MTTNYNTVMTYDAQSRLSSVSALVYTNDEWRAELLVSNRYDHIGRRVKKITPAATHTFFYDGWNLIEERVAHTSGTNTIIRYYWGKDLSGTLQGAGGVGGLLCLTISTSNIEHQTPNSSTQQLFIPCYDNNGNITRYLDANGTTVAQYSYDAFGNLLNKSGAMCDVFRHLFSTKYYDIETELYYYGYRFYCPWLMRWINRDPIGEEGGGNLYAMCANDCNMAYDAIGLSRMITGALVTDPNRVFYHGESFARDIVREIDKLNRIKNIWGDSMFEANIRDFALTSTRDVWREVVKHADDVYIIAHGGIFKDNKIVAGAYSWKKNDTAIEGFLPGGKKGRFVPLSSLGPKLNDLNIFGCYISKRVRRVGGISTIDDYEEMYKALLARLVRYESIDRKTKCKREIIVYEGENGGEDLATSAALAQYPVQCEEYYEQWMKDLRKKIENEGRQ